MIETPEDHGIKRTSFSAPSSDNGRARDLYWAYFCLVLAIPLTSFLALIVMGGPRLGLTDRHALIETQGTLHTSRDLKSTIHFSLFEHPHRFIYPSKAGGGLSVYRALRASANLKLWHERPGENYRAGIDMLTVFQIEADGKIVRRYEDVERAWVENNSMTPWMLAVFVAMTLYLLIYLILAWRKKT